MDRLLGFEGDRVVQQTSRDVARYAADAIFALGPFKLITDGSQPPVFAFTLADADVPYTVFDVSERLRGPRSAGHPPPCRTSEDSTKSTVRPCR